MKKLGLFLGVALLSAQVFAADFKASLAQMPVYAESKDKGVLVDLVKAIAKVSGKTIDFQVVPFARSMSDVEKGEVNFHMPLILPLDLSKANFDVSTETIFHVNFTLYSNKKKPLDPAKLEGKNVETDTAHTPYFPFAIKPSSTLDGSIKRVDAGLVDGFVFADAAIDPLVKSLQLKNIKRELYKRFDVKIILPKGQKGGATDKFLSDAIGKLRASGEYDKIMGALDAKFDPWQP